MAVRRRLLTAGLAGAVAVVAAPALASPAQAAAVALTAEQVRSELSIAEGTTRQALLSTGGTGATTLRSGSFSTGSRTTLVVDAARKTARTSSPYAGLDAFPGADRDELPPVFFDDPCEPDLFAADTPTTVVRAGVGTYSEIRRGSSRYVREGRRLVDRPKARWMLERGPANLAAAIELDSLVSSLVGSTDDDLPSLTPVLGSGTRTTTPTGTRISATFEDAVFFSAEATVDVDLDQAGRVVRSVLDDSVDGETFSITYTTTFGARTVAVPKGKQVVEAKVIRPGCRAALIRHVVVDLPKEIKKAVNSRATKRKPVTAAQIRRATAKSLSAYSGLGVRDNDVAGGAELVGRHRLLKKPQQRSIVVRNGKAVILKGGRA